jgi:transposase
MVKIKIIKKNILLFNNTIKVKLKFINLKMDNSIYFTYIKQHNRHLKNIRSYKLIINKMLKEKTIINNLICPSILKSIVKDKKIEPFWNNKIQNLSNKLFMPSNENIKQINNDINTFNYNSWFNVTKFVPLNDNNEQHECFNYINKEYSESELIKTTKIKLYLDNDQKRAYKQIVGTYRYYYNRCVDYFNNFDKGTNSTFYYINSIKKENKITINIPNDKNRYSYMVAREYLNKVHPTWLLANYPIHLIDQAIIECCNRMKTCIKQYITHKIKFVLKHKKKSELVQTINLEGRMIRPNNKPNNKSVTLFRNWKVFDKYLFRNIRLSEKIPGTYGSGSLSYHTVLKEYYINISYTDNTINIDSNRLGAVDQGVRTPYTIYSQDDVVLIGDGCTDVLFKKCKELDIIQSRLNRSEYYVIKDGVKIIYKMTSNRKRNLRNALHRKIKDIKNLRSELHNKTIKFLTDTYKGIILPPFNIKEMTGKLNNKVSRSMYTLSFYIFRQKLKAKALSKNITVFEYCEPYTSKTCGSCGLLNYTLGGSKHFNCSSCDLKIDRDINGARNILLRNLQFIN